MMFTIFDLDNCIADDHWRIRTIAWWERDLLRRYHVYHSLARFDCVANGELLVGVAPRDIVVFTARPQRYAALTVEWLRRNVGRTFAVFMRDDDDYRPSAELKFHQLRRFMAEYAVCVGDIRCAYDDRADCVAMYRRAGVAAEQRAIHALSAYAPRGAEEHASW